MIAHFTSTYLNNEIEKNGFAIVPFANQPEIEKLKKFYRSLPELPVKGTHVTMFHPSYAYRKRIDEKIQEIFTAKAESYLVDYRVLYTNLMIKESGPEGDFPVHQDWTYVDETQFASYAFWVPLQDVNITNGALHVVRGSHRFTTMLRGPYVYEPFKQISKQIKAYYAETVILKAGEALLWDHRLIHFSLPNISTQSRMAFTLIAVPKQAQTIHCFGIDETRGISVEKYLVDNDFFMRYAIGKRPEGVVLKETISQQEVNFTEQQFVDLLKY